MRRPPPSVSRAVYALQERALGRRTFAMLRSLQRSESGSRAEIEALQLRRLRDLLRIAHAHSPWHRDRLDRAGLGAGGVHCLADLARLPTMDKRDASANVESLVWRGVPGGAYPYNTGGSSGQPLIFHFGRSRQASDAAGRMRARGWWGVQPGDPEVYLWGAPVELSKTDRVKTLRDRLINQLVLNAFSMSPARMDEYLVALQAFRPRCVYGYASSVALLAAHAQARGRHLHLPELKVVCTTGEPLFEHQRALIGEVFGAPVANEFGSRDIGFTAHEAPGGQMLLLSENIVLEVLDAQGRPAAPGELGEAVMTGLCSEAQPFIRYRTGDMLRMATEPAQGGLGLHVIAEVAGRSTDFLVRADGTIMHALAVIYVLRATPGVGEFKIVQQGVRDLDVQVVADARWSDSSRLQIEQGLCQRLGDDVRVNVRLVEGIAPEASGKHRYVVSHVALDPALKPAGAPVGAVVPETP